MQAIREADCVHEEDALYIRDGIIQRGRCYYRDCPTGLKHWGKETLSKVWLAIRPWLTSHMGIGISNVEPDGPKVRLGEVWLTPIRPLKGFRLIRSKIRQLLTTLINAARPEHGEKWLSLRGAKLQVNWSIDENAFNWYSLKKMKITRRVRRELFNFISRGEEPRWMEDLFILQSQWRRPNPPILFPC